MNIVEVLKIARGGQTIKRRNEQWSWKVAKNGTIEFSDVLRWIVLGHLTADDWEIVKEKKKVELDNIKWTHYGGISSVIPTGGDFDWPSLENKITKLTIEWEE
jgi:hypothetical protein